MTKIYVGNLSFDATEDDLRQAFGKFGEVASVSIVTERDSGRPRGFAFVEMDSKEFAQKAIDGLNNMEIGGRAINVSEARPKPPRAFGGGGAGRFRNRR